MKIGVRSMARPFRLAPLAACALALVSADADAQFLHVVERLGGFTVLRTRDAFLVCVVWRRILRGKVDASLRNREVRPRGIHSKLTFLRRHVTPTVCVSNVAVTRVPLSDCGDGRILRFPSVQSVSAPEVVGKRRGQRLAVFRHAARLRSAAIRSSGPRARKYSRRKRVRRARSSLLRLRMSATLRSRSMDGFSSNRARD